MLLKCNAIPRSNHVCVLLCHLQLLKHLLFGIYISLCSHAHMCAKMSYEKRIKVLWATSIFCLFCCCCHMNLLTCVCVQSAICLCLWLPCNRSYDWFSVVLWVLGIEHWFYGLTASNLNQFEPYCHSHVIRTW